jgi:WD40 repeat protein
MKKLHYLIFTIYLLLTFPLFSQGTTDCDKKLAQVRILMQADSPDRDYAQASSLLRYLRAVSEDDCPKKIRYIDQMIDSLNVLILADRDSALIQKKRAEAELHRNARTARANANVILAEKLAYEDYTSGLQVAMANYLLYPEVEIAWAKAENMLFPPMGIGGTVVQKFELTSDSVAPNRIHTFTSDKKSVVGTSKDGKVLVWDLGSREVIRTFPGAKSQVSALTLSDDDSILAIADINGEVIIRDMTSGTQINTFSGDSASVHVIAISPDGEWVATGNSLGRVQLWNIFSGKTIHSFIAHEDVRGYHGVMGLKFLPDGASLLSGGADGLAKLWDAKTGKLTQTYFGHHYMIGALNISPNGNFFVTGDWDGNVFLWQKDYGYPIRKLKSHLNSIDNVAFHPGGDFILAGGARGGGNMGKLKSSMVLWDKNNDYQFPRSYFGPGAYISFSKFGGHIFSAKGSTISMWSTFEQEEDCQLGGGHREVAVELALSRDGKTLLSGSWDNTARLWDTQTGEELHILRGHSGPVSAVSFCADGKRVLTGSRDETIILWDAKSGAILKRFRDYPEEGYADIYSLAVTPDDKAFVSGGFDGIAKLWDLQTGNIIRTFPGHSQPIGSLDISPDGKYLATGILGDTVVIYNLRTGKEERVFSPRHGIQNGGFINSISFSPNGKDLLVSGLGNTASIWDLDEGRKKQEFIGHESGVNCARFSSDGERVITGSYDKTVKNWDTQTGKLLKNIPSRSSPISSIALSHDGLYVYVSDEGPGIYKYDWEAGKKMHFFPPRQMKGGSLLELSPDNQYVVTAGEDYAIRMWEMESGKMVKELVGHQGTISTLKYMDNGRTLVSGSRDSTLRIWDMSTGRCQRVLTGHQGPIRAMEISVDQNSLLTGSTDKTIRLWDLKSGKQIKTIKTTDNIVTALSMNPERSIAAVSFSSEKEEIQLWDLHKGEIITTLLGSKKRSINARVTGLKFLSDGEHLLSVSRVGLRLWKIKDGKGSQVWEREPKRARPGSFYSVHTTPGEAFCLTEGGGYVQLWEVASGKHIRDYSIGSSNIKRRQIGIDQKADFIVVPAGRVNTVSLPWGYLKRITPKLDLLELKAQGLQYTPEDLQQMRVEGRNFLFGE